MKTEHFGLVLVSLAIIGLSAAASAFLAAGRYTVYSAGSDVYIVDRFSGEVRTCLAGDCDPFSQPAKAIRSPP
jgi:hypothetical protein